MATDTIGGALRFLRDAEKLKTVLRSGRLSDGRPESTAEHTWRLCLMAFVFEGAFEGVDFAKLLKICLVHDLGEAMSGDVPAVDQRPDAGKSERERADLAALTEPLHPAKRDEIMALWEEYEAAASPEAVLAKGLDKLETILQHNQGRNAPGFDYAFNLGYGQERTSAHPLLAEIRRHLDEDTLARASPPGTRSAGRNGG
jgi:putative hydrolase of HD superfamily